MENPFGAFIFHFLPLFLLGNIFPYLCKIRLHALRIFIVYNLKKLFEFGAYLCHLVMGIRIEENLLKQVVVFRQHSLGNTHMPFEGCARSILMLHDSSKDECGDKRY